MNRTKLGWLLLSPTLLILGLFGIFPFIYVLWVSFHQWNPFAANPNMLKIPSIHARERGVLSASM